jgi:hypothetical protein
MNSSNHLNHLTVPLPRSCPLGRRRLSPPRGAGWEPVNTYASGYLQSQEESTPASTVCKLGLQV